MLPDVVLAEGAGFDFAVIINRYFPVAGLGVPRQSGAPTRPVLVAGLAFDWHAVDAGGILRARATDAAGNILSAVPAWYRLGHGNNAVDVIYVDVHQ